MMSKRKILQLVKTNAVRGWDDPRLCTLAGLKRRGFSPDILNAFCREIGVTRARSIQDMEKLENLARKALGVSAARCMAVMDPLKVVITNLPAEETVSVSAYPQDADSTEKHVITLTKILYIERSDFQLKPDDDFFGLGPGREALLKYIVLTV
jgi:glutaminyl-tRNA synthetase